LTSAVAWIWSATDYAENTPVNETFGIRFKTVELATAFKQAFDAAREKVAKAGDSASDTGKVSGLSKGSAASETVSEKKEGGAKGSAAPPAASKGIK